MILGVFRSFREVLTPRCYCHCFTLHHLYLALFTATCNCSSYLCCSLPGLKILLVKWTCQHLLPLHPTGHFHPAGVWAEQGGVSSRSVCFSRADLKFLCPAWLKVSASPPSSAETASCNSWVPVSLGQEFPPSSTADIFQCRVRYYIK